jgi:hypothetical protein
MEEQGWTVHAEAAGDAGEVTEDALATFQELLADRGGAVSGEPGRYGATFSIYRREVRTDVPEEVAVAEWIPAVFETKAHDAGLPTWRVARFEVTTFAEHDADLERPAFPELVGIKEIAGILAVSPQRAHQLTKREDFPDPIARLAAGPVWTRPSLERFIDDWRAGKPDNSEIVAQVDGLIAKLTAIRNQVVHGRPTGPDPSEDVHTTLREILDRAEIMPHLPRATLAARAYGGGSIEPAPADIVDRERTA